MTPAGHLFKAHILYYIMCSRIVVWKIRKLMGDRGGVNFKPGNKKYAKNNVLIYRFILLLCRTFITLSHT